MSEAPHTEPPARLPEHVIAQLRWLIDNPWHVGAAAALADELATWVATSPGSRPLDDFFDAMKRRRVLPGIVNRILNYFSDQRPPVVNWDGLLAIDLADFICEPGVGMVTFMSLVECVAFCGAMPPPHWLRVIAERNGPGLDKYFESLVRIARRNAANSL